MAECNPVVIETSNFILFDGTSVAEVARIRREQFGLGTCAIGLFANGSPEANCIVSCLLAEQRRSPVQE